MRSPERSRSTKSLSEAFDPGSGGETPIVSGKERALGDIDREPDDNGIDDAPVAIDDPVTARTGVPVPVAVTNNDYDPDGEAIAVIKRLTLPKISTAG